MLLYLSIVIAFKIQICKSLYVQYHGYKTKEESNKLTKVPQNNYKPKTSTTLT